jgi:hypothetical protein
MAGKFTVGNFNKAKGVPGKTALGETKDGAPQLTVVFEGVGGKTGGDEIERRFMLNDERLAYTMDTLTLMGWGGDWEDFSGIGKNTVSLKISQSDQYGLQVDFVNEDKPFILAPEKKTARRSAPPRAPRPPLRPRPPPKTRAPTSSSRRLTSGEHG